MESLDEELLASVNESDASNRSACSKCAYYCLLPLDCLLWPIIRCMNASFWSQHRHYQYDLSIQLMAIYQTLIGALWSSTILTFIESFNHSDELETVYLALYCIITYAVCNIIVIIMQRKQFFNDKISFFLGTLGEIVAFGIYTLAFKIMETHFSSSFKDSFVYFWICLIVSITMIYTLSFLRKQCCFAMQELKEHTAEMRQQIADKCSQMNPSYNIYESDFMNLLLQNEDDESIQHQNEAGKESFAALLKEIDTDLYTIAMGGVFVELIIYSLTGCYLQLSDSIESQPNYSLQYIPVYIASTVAILWFIILVIFILFNAFITSIQMRRDRALYKIFHKLHIRAQSNRILPAYDTQMDENCLIAACIKCSYKWYKLSEHVVAFITGFLGWSYGWALVAGIYWFDTVRQRFHFSLCTTAGAILLYFIRSKGLKIKYDKWKKSAKQTMDEEEKKGNEEEAEYDMFKMKARHHRTLYAISNWNFFFRKCYGLIIALPWELTFDLAIEHLIGERPHAILVRFVVAIAATVVLSYCGVQFVDIQSKAQHHSTSHAVSQLLKGNYMRLKKFGINSTDLFVKK